MGRKAKKFHKKFKILFITIEIQDAFLLVRKLNFIKTPINCFFLENDLINTHFTHSLNLNRAFSGQLIEHTHAQFIIHAKTFISRLL